MKAANWAVALGLPILWVRLTTPLTPYDDEPFNSDAWIAATDCQVGCVRGKMVYSLQDRYLKAGMSKREVVKILGPANPSSGPKPSKNHSIVNYLIGNWSGMKIDSDFLAIEFDENEKLVQSWMWQS